MEWDDRCEITELIGKTLTAVEKNGDSELFFICDDGSKYKMFHDQD